MPVSSTENMFKSDDRRKLLNYLSKRTKLNSSVPISTSMTTPTESFDHVLKSNKNQPKISSSPSPNIIETAKVTKKSNRKFNIDSNENVSKVITTKTKLPLADDMLSKRSSKSLGVMMATNSSSGDDSGKKRKRTKKSNLQNSASNDFIVTELESEEEPKKNSKKKKKNKKAKLRTEDDIEEDKLKQDVNNLLAAIGGGGGDNGDEDYEDDDYVDDDEEILTSSSNSKSNKKSSATDKIVEVHQSRSEQLANRARQTLANSLFRSLNEFLYSNQSDDARKSFTSNKFQLYHQAYEKIMADWPVKPIDFLIDVLRKRIKPNQMSKTVIGDVGCGNRPQIAIAFPDAIVHSYDLYSNMEDSNSGSNPYSIIAADMSRLPLDSEQCDYLVYSLSLMPTNLRDCLYDANRVLKPGGYMMVVEVSSRFADYQSKNSGKIAVEKHCGHRFSADLRLFGFQLTRHEMLPPNGYFVFFSLKKVEKLQGKKPKATLPAVTLKACVYKAR